MPGVKESICSRCVHLSQEMEECPTWSCDNKDGNPAWTEYLMWDRAKDSDYPLKLAYKYFNDPEIDAELDRCRKWEE